MHRTVFLSFENFSGVFVQSFGIGEVLLGKGERNEEKRRHSFALSAFMVEQLNKEMSIRLVLGASTNSIFRLLTQSFIVMVLISFVIAIPVGIYLMEKWLNDFQYKIPLTWDVFALAGGISLMIAILTVSYQSMRAARANPVPG
jgi:hypothetical protein